MSELHKQLSSLDKKQLIEVVAALYGYDDELDQRIDTLIMVNNPKQQYKALKKRIQSLKNSSRFIDYSESFAFSRTLDALVGEINAFIGQAPEWAFDLSDLFLKSHSNTFERVDDSSGSIGESYRDGVDVWLNAAQACRASGCLDSGCLEKDWQDRVYQWFNDNDYGVLDGLLPGSGELLTQDELTQLAWRFETAAKQALDKHPQAEGYNSQASHACIGLRSVAEALGDIELFARATLIQSPKPNELQRKQIIQFCLSQKKAAAAMKWLNEPWEPRFEYDRLTLLDACYQQTGDAESLKATRREFYKKNPSFESMQNLKAVLPEQEQKVLLKQAVQDATTLKYLAESVTMLLKLAAINEAERLLFQRLTELSECSYGTLTEWVKAFKKEQRYLASVFCYRALLEDILNKGRSKAYYYAADYFKQLLKLDTQVNDYQHYPNAKQFIITLQDKHWRKRSFWEKAQHPNKGCEE